MRSARTLVALLLPLALLGACGDDDSDTDAASTTSSSSASTAPPSSADGDDGGEEAVGAPDRVADQALADSVVLTLDDLGPGWTVSEEDDEGDEDDAEDELFEDELAECLGVDPDEIPDDSDDPEAVGTFEREGELALAQIEATASVSPTLDEIETVFDLFDSPRFIECYRPLLDRQLQEEQPEEEGFEFTDVELDELEVPAGLGDAAFGLRLVVSAEAEGTPFDLYEDLYFVRRGRVGIFLMALGAFEPVPVDYSRSLASLMDQRAAAA
jgi:hypothetical protein